MKAIWFSKVPPTSAQLEDAARIGYNIVAIEEGITLGRVDLNDHRTLNMVMDRLKGLLFTEDATVILGVFPVPVLSYMWQTYYDEGALISCHSPWRVKRTLEDGSFTLEHLEWCLVGFMRV